MEDNNRTPRRGRPPKKKDKPVADQVTEQVDQAVEEDTSDPYVVEGEDVLNLKRWAATQLGCLPLRIAEGCSKLKTEIDNVCSAVCRNESTSSIVFCPNSYCSEIALLMSQWPHQLAEQQNECDDSKEKKKDNLKQKKTKDTAGNNNNAKDKVMTDIVDCLPPVVMIVSCAMLTDANDLWNELVEQMVLEIWRSRTENNCELSRAQKMKEYFSVQDEVQSVLKERSKVDKGETLLALREICWSKLKRNLVIVFCQSEALTRLQTRSANASVSVTYVLVDNLHHQNVAEEEMRAKRNTNKASAKKKAETAEEENTDTRVASLGLIFQTQLVNFSTLFPPKVKSRMGTRVVDCGETLDKKQLDEFLTGALKMKHYENITPKMVQFWNEKIDYIINYLFHETPSLESNFEIKAVEELLNRFFNDLIRYKPVQPSKRVPDYPNLFSVLILTPLENDKSQWTEPSRNLVQPQTPTTDPTGPTTPQTIVNKKRTDRPDAIMDSSRQRRKTVTTISLTLDTLFLKFSRGAFEDQSKAFLNYRFWNLHIIEHLIFWSAVRISERGSSLTILAILTDVGQALQQRTDLSPQCRFSLETIEEAIFKLMRSGSIAIDRSLLRQHGTIEDENVQTASHKLFSMTNTTSDPLKITTISNRWPAIRKLPLVIPGLKQYETLVNKNPASFKFRSYFPDNSIGM